MTDQQLADDLERRAKLATPLPWGCTVKPVVTHATFAYLVAPREDSLDCVSLGSNRMNYEDQQFVSAMVNALPRVLAALRARPEVRLPEPTHAVLEAMVRAMFDMDHSDLKWSDAMKMARKAHRAAREAESPMNARPEKQ